MHPVDRFLLSEGRDVVWELFHENSKTSRTEPHIYFGKHPSERTIVDMMNSLREVKPYTDREKFTLPVRTDRPSVSLDTALLGRESARGFGTSPIRIADLAFILQCAHGVTRDNSDTAYPRPFRAAPSGGALYPLELYVWSRRIEGLPVGLYHYDGKDHSVDALGAVDLESAFVQQDLVQASAAAILVSAVFFRSVFKYGERGYRFVLLEAGHVVQNALLAAGGRELAAVPIGGYFDRDIDSALGLDGLNESVIYCLLIGCPE